MSGGGVHPTPFPMKIQPLWQRSGALWDSLGFMGNRPGAGHGSKAGLCLKSRISAGLVLPFSGDFLPSTGAPGSPGNCIPGILEWGFWVWRSLHMENSRFKPLPELLRPGGGTASSQVLFLCWCFPIFDGFSLKMTPVEDFFFFFLLSKWEKLFWEVGTGPSSPLLRGKGCAGNTLRRKWQEKSEVGVGDLGINPGE